MHGSGSGDRYIVNAGPMIRREATEYNFQHRPGFFVWNIAKERMTWVEIPHEKAEVVLSRLHIEYEETSEMILDDFISSVKEHINVGSDFMTNLVGFLKANEIKQSVVDVLEATIGKERFHGRH